MANFMIVMIRIGIRETTVETRKPVKTYIRTPRLSQVGFIKEEAENQIVRARMAPIAKPLETVKNFSRFTVSQFFHAQTANAA